MTRIRRVLTGIGALLALLALLVGVPWLLCHFIGWPLPRRVPSLANLGHDLSERGIPDKTLVDALAVVVWIVWALLAISVLAESVATARGARATRVPMASLFQPLTGKLVAAVLVAVLALAPRNVSPRATTAALAPSSGRPVAAAVLADVQLTTTRVPLMPARADDPTNASREPTDATTATRTYVVQRGDTLWGIAKRELGDPMRWREIAALNEGRHEGESTFSDPHWIDPGWTLLLPSEEPNASHHATAPSHSASVPSSGAASQPDTSPAKNGDAAGSSSTSTQTTVPATARPADPREPSAQHGDNHSARPASVRLPSGSVVGGSFAIGILGALALARRRRRHAYRYRPPMPGRRLDAEPLGPTLRALADTITAPSDDPGNERVVVPTEPADANPDHRERPDLVEIGTVGGEVRSVLLTDLAGVCFVGERADSVVRALLCSLLTRSGPIAAEVLATAATFEQLFPGVAERAARGEVPGVRIVPSNGAICALLDAEVESRTSQFALDDATDVFAYRQMYSWDPMPTVIALIDQLDESSAERWQAVFTKGARLGLGTIVLDKSTADSERNVEIGDDCTATVVSNVLWSGLVDGVRCFAIEANEAAEIFAALTTAEERPTSEEPAIDRVPRLVEDGDIEGVTESETPGEPWPEVSEIEESDVAPPITVRVFGPYEIAVNGRVIDKGLRTVARELLAWYLLRPEGASRGAVVEACWPDTAPAAVSNTFWRPVGDLRRLVGAAADPPTKLLESAGGEVYRLDVAAIDCDLWRFQAALVVAARAESDEDARRALREAVDCYRGEFLDGIDYFWVEPIREDLHRRALDAHLRLAELEGALDNPDGAEVALHAAAEFDRYAEEPYRRLMTLQAQRGRLDAVATTWRLLERRLAEIDIDPEPTTVRLHRSLIAERESMGDERLRRTS